MWCYSLSKVIEPLRSRCLCIHVPTQTEDELIKWTFNIASLEKIKLNFKLTKEQQDQLKKGKMINFYEIPSFKEYEKKEYEKIKYIKDVIIEQGIIDDCIEKFKKYEPQDGEILKIVNIDKINNLWKKDKALYISEIYEEIKFPNKYLNSRKDLLEKNITIPPKIIYDEENDLISFENGRHRFSNLRDLGCKEIPVIILNEDKEKIEELLKKNIILN